VVYLASDASSISPEAISSSTGDILAGDLGRLNTMAGRSRPSVTPLRRFLNLETAFELHDREFCTVLRRLYLFAQAGETRHRDAREGTIKVPVTFLFSD